MSCDVLSVSIPGGFPADLGFKRPTGEVLEKLGFSQGILQNSLDADGMRFSACLAPWGWCVSREGRLLGREAIMPNEAFLAPSCAPIEVMGAMFTLWAEVYVNRRPQHEALCLGKQWLDFKEKTLSLIPQLPTLRVDRVFFRQCLKYIEKRQDWMVADFDIHLSQAMCQ